MKATVVYYSLSGNTDYAAQKIAEELGAKLLRIEPQKAYPATGLKKFMVGGKGALGKATPALQPYQFDADACDLVVLGLPMWAWSITPPMRTFIEENKEALQGKKVAAFACSSGGNTEKMLEKLRECIGIGAFAAQLSLVDPKTKPDPANDMRITAFCNSLKKD